MPQGLEASLVQITKIKTYKKLFLIFMHLKKVKIKQKAQCFRVIYAADKDRPVAPNQAKYRH